MFAGNAGKQEKIHGNNRESADEKTHVYSTDGIFSCNNRVTSR